jgi:hypothetical protein
MASTSSLASFISSAALGMRSTSETARLFQRLRTSAAFFCAQTLRWAAVTLP